MLLGGRQHLDSQDFSRASLDRKGILQIYSTQKGFSTDSLLNAVIGIGRAQTWLQVLPL